MTRYYFDIHDDQGLWPDEEGTELPNIQAAEIEAAQSLAEMAEQAIKGNCQQRMAVEVRTAEGPLFQATFIFEVKSLQ